MKSCSSIPVSRQLLVLSAVVMILATSTFSMENLRTPQFMAKVRPAFVALYNLNYDHGSEILLKLEKEYPEHPAPPLYLGTVIWLKQLFERHELNLNYFLSPSYFTRKTGETMPEAKKKAFLDYIKKSEDLSREILKKQPKDLDALFFLGAAYGVRASFEITVDHRVSSALSYGKQAYKYEDEVVRKDPKYYDAYLTVGMYQYIVGSLPWYIKFIANLIGYHGSKEQGFRDLELAAEKGEYSADDAKVLLMVLYVREQDYQKALSNARTLADRFTENYIFQINQAQILEKMGHTEKAIEKYLAVQKKAQEGVPNYSKIPLGIYYYQLGDKFLQLNHLDLAKKELQDCIQSQQADEDYRAWAHLRLGQLYDLQGKRSEAVQQYKTVEGMKDYNNSHKVAREYLKHPYQRRR